MITMRADFYARCAAYPELAGAVGSHQFLVSPMDAPGLRAAIQDPPARFATRSSPGSLR